MGVTGESVGARVFAVGLNDGDRVGLVTVGAFVGPSVR